MLHIDTSDPAQLELRSRQHGCSGFFGVVFALVGGALLALAFGRLPVTAPIDIDPAAMPVIGAVGAVFLLLGLLMMGGRRGIRLSPHEQMAVRWFGLFVPLKHSSRPLNDFQRVSLTREIRGGNKNRQVVFPVRLEGHGPAFELDSGDDYHTSRRLAESAARFLRLPMTDASSGEEVVRDPEHLDESFRDRARRLGEEFELPPQPEGLRSTIAGGGSELQLDIPSPAVDARRAIKIIVPIGFVGFVLFSIGTPFLSRTDDPRHLAIGVGVLLLTLGLPIVAVLRSLRAEFRTSRVSVDHSTLRIERGGSLTEIPIDELEELTVIGRDAHQLLTLLPDGSAQVNPKLLDSPAAIERLAREGRPPTLNPAIAKLLSFVTSLAPDQKCIMARSDTATIYLGRGLPTGELAYLWALMAQVICR